MKKIVAVLLVIILVSIAVISLNKASLDKKSPSLPLQSASPTVSNSVTPVKVSVGAIPSIPFKLPDGFVIHTFARGLGVARDLQFSPGGTLLVSNPDSGIVYALPDKNKQSLNSSPGLEYKDGVADSKKIIISGENRPHGLAFYNNKLYVAEVDKVVRYVWDEDKLTATKDKVLFSLPQNSDHNSRTITFDKVGNMYVSVGSTCNVCNEASNLSGTVMVSDAEGNNPTVFAKGLRNAPFIQFNPKTGELWGTEMGRDLLGDNIPPDEINIIRPAMDTGSRDYGWPNCYGTKTLDTSFNKSANCANTEPPIYEIPAHSAPLGLTFINSPQFPSDWQGDLLVALHGSWNRTTPIGYKVVHLKVNGNTITGSEDFLRGFISSSAIVGAQAQGRPVDLTFDSLGNLFLSDDKTGSVYIIQKP